MFDRRPTSKLLAAEAWGLQASIAGISLAAGHAHQVGPHVHQATVGRRHPMSFLGLAVGFVEGEVGSRSGAVPVPWCSAATSPCARAASLARKGRPPAPTGGIAGHIAFQPTNPVISDKSQFAAPTRSLPRCNGNARRVSRRAAEGSFGHIIFFFFFVSSSIRYG